MKIKDGVIMPDHITMRRVLMEAEKIWSKLGEELVVTSGKEGTHSASSYHYYGRAVDLRTRYFSAEDAQKAFYMLADILSLIDKGYAVVLHETHIHVQWSCLNACNNN